MRYLRSCALLFLIFGVSLLAQNRLPPADPLTSEEIERANKVATDAARKQLGNERLELVSTSLANVKPAPTGERQPDPKAADVARHAIVTFYNYGRDEGFAVLVNLNTTTVAETVAVPSRSIGLARTETARAVDIALGNPEVRRRVHADRAEYQLRSRRAAPDGDVVDAIPIRGTTPNDPCARERCVELFFQIDGRYIVGQRIVVNLTRGTVTAETMPAARVQP